MENNFFLFLLMCVFVNSTLKERNCCYNINIGGDFQGQPVKFFINEEQIFFSPLNMNYATGENDLNLRLIKETDSTYYVANTYSQATHYVLPNLDLSNKKNLDVFAKNKFDFFYIDIMVSKKMFSFKVDKTKGNHIYFYYKKDDQKITLSQR